MIKRKDITLRTETLLCLFALCFLDANRMYRNKRFCFFCRLVNVTCKTRDKGQQENSRILCRCCDKETADRRKQSAEKSWPNHVKNEQHIYRIWKELRPPKYWTVLTQWCKRTANENAAGLQRTTKEQPRHCFVVFYFAWSDLLQILRKLAAFSFAVLCIIVFGLSKKKNAIPL